MNNYFIDLTITNNNYSFLIKTHLQFHPMKIFWFYHLFYHLLLSNIKLI